MRRYTATKPLLAKHFCSDFRAHVRSSVSRLKRDSEHVGYAMYAEKYGLDYEYVVNLATIGGEIDNEILVRMGLDARPKTDTCTSCGSTSTATVFISR